MFLGKLVIKMIESRVSRGGNGYFYFWDELKRSEAE